MIRCTSHCSAVVLFALALAAVPAPAQAAGPEPSKCDQANPTLPQGGTGLDLIVSAGCNVTAGSYHYKSVNVVGPKGSLNFAAEGEINFFATGIVVESGAALVAGSPADPIGAKPGSSLTIHLYGPAQTAGSGIGIDCQSKVTDDLAYCGIPMKVWCSQPDATAPGPHDGTAICPLPRPTTHQKVGMPGTVSPVQSDWFYRYHPLPYDEGINERTMMPGYFGYKVLGVSWGGTLQLFGKQGSTFDGADPDVIVKSGSGKSWRRLAATARGGDKILLDEAVDWKDGDEIVVTTTDYLPGHSEVRKIKTIDPVGRKAITLTTALNYTHNGSMFDVASADNGVPARLGLGTNTRMDNRAAVALLTRSIKVVSDGDAAGSPLAGYIGGHLVVRQGVKQLQLQGVEFVNMGQGGRIGHYPVHFHLARKVPKDTFVKDTSVNESMTRWYVIHGTHNVTLARNVGWKSIGHGYYLEEGTEIDNNLFSNIGIYARAALDYPDNPRKVPGILAHARIADPDNPAVLKPENVPFYSDYDHPSVFWIMNGWNRFENNMAVGASACGICYWMLPGAVSGHSMEQQWEGYAVIQMGEPNNAITRAGYTPVKSFTGNFCSTASMSFNTTANTSACIGVGLDITTPDKYLTIDAVENPLAPPPCDQSNPLWPAGKLPHPASYPYVPWACNQPAYKASLGYYPQVGGGGRFPTRCDDTSLDKSLACKTVHVCGQGEKDIANCMVTVIDRYTTSFHWAEQNFAAIWLRPQWYLLSNSFVTDVVNSGLTFVTGGGYTDSDAVYGHWALAFRTVFIGETQDPKAPGNAATPFTSNLSPFNPMPGALTCATGVGENNRCIDAKEGVAFPRSSFGINQRLFNIYDGPAYQSSNAYLNIRRATPDCAGGVCEWKKWLFAPLLGLPKDPVSKSCYMPNAAIGWKQPNGFYYPPAFHSDNLYFHNVDVRHYVTQPLFEGTSYKTDFALAQATYCNSNDTMFSGFTDVDRQTELNDDDGSLTGWKDTISVNKDPFFSGPKEDIECASDLTAKTSPYDYVTSVVYPKCLTESPTSCGTTVLNGVETPLWNMSCANQNCAGVPLYRQYDVEAPTGPRHFIRMSGQSTGQRSTLATNNGLYYIDTTVGIAKQVEILATGVPAQAATLSVFEAEKTYYSFLLYAKPTTRQTYQVFVGKSTGANDPNGFDPNTDVWPVTAEIRTNPPVFKDVGKLTWPATWSRTYDPSTGILEVTMDMNRNEAFESAYKKGLAEGCQPSSFCKRSRGTCGCAINPVTNQPEAGCTADVCKWAGKDTACPDGGCWGFRFRLAKSWGTQPKPASPPDTECFPMDTAAGWNVEPKDPDPRIESTGNTCYKPPMPKAVFCKKPG